MSATALYADSKLYSDWLLKAITVQRRVGPENVRVTSFGKAREETIYTDHYGRKWQIRTWPIEYDDTMAVSFALPTPEGYVAMLRTVPTEGLQNTRSEMRVLADFLYVSYGGSLAQWRDFLAVKDLLPTAFGKIDIDFEYDQAFH